MSDERCDDCVKKGRKLAWCDWFHHGGRERWLEAKRSPKKAAAYFNENGFLVIDFERWP